MKYKKVLFLFLVSVVASKASISSAEEAQVFGDAQLQQQVNQQIPNNAVAQQQSPVNNFYINAQPQQNPQNIVSQQQLSNGGRIEVVQQNQPVNYVVDEVTGEQEEKDKKYEKSRFGVTIGYAKQEYTGEYKDEVKFFQNLNNSTKEEGTEGRNVDATHSINIGVFYDKIANIYAFINPFIGFEVDINIPVSSQNSYDYRYNDVYGTKIYTEEMPVGYATMNFLSNFIDAKIRVGNIFRFGENFNISVYANVGFASALYGHENGFYRGGYNQGGGYTYLFDNTSNESETTVKFLAGYTYGAGVDVVIAKHYLIGAFYERKRMLSGEDIIFKPLDGKEYLNPISKYENNTIGLRIGIVF